MGNQAFPRLRFEFSADVYERLTEMKEKAGAADFSILIRDALRVYEWCLDQQRAGFEIGLFREGEPVKRVYLIR